MDRLDGDSLDKLVTTNVMPCFKEPEEEMLGIVCSVDVSAVGCNIRSRLADTAIFDKGYRSIDVIGSQVLDWTGQRRSMVWACRSSS